MKLLAALLSIVSIAMNAQMNHDEHTMNKGTYGMQTIDDGTHKMRSMDDGRGMHEMHSMDTGTEGMPEMDDDSHTMPPMDDDMNESNSTDDGHDDMNDNMHEMHSMDDDMQEMHSMDEDTHKMHSMDDDAHEMHSMDDDAHEMHSMDDDAHEMHSMDGDAHEMHSMDDDAHEMHSMDDDAHEMHSMDGDAHEMHSMTFPLWSIYPSSVIAGFGLILNLMSLFYFVKRSDDQDLGTKLLMLLNVLDLLVCLTGVVLQSLLVTSNRSRAVQMLNFAFVEATGFATCLLSITRCIRIYAPFFEVRGRAAAISLGIFMTYCLIKEIGVVQIYINIAGSHKFEGTFNMVHCIVGLTEIGLMVVVVLCSSLAFMYKLDRENGQNTTFRHATITVAILSASFCVLNCFFIVAMILHFFIHNHMHNIALIFGNYFAVPLNSATNPLIYFLRKKHMRDFLCNLKKSAVGTEPTPHTSPSQVSSQLPA